MKLSRLLLATLKESPADAELMSHQLMLRAGMIRKLASGLYTWLPLGLRVLHKVEAIVREEMNHIGAQEILMPAVQPAELWQETERWEQYGPLLLKIYDRHQREFCFGPTHEEVITDLVRDELNSYKQLPCCLYQIQTKFRDEIRPRYGVMRAREFLMKDAYSFHLDTESLKETYQQMYQAYSNIFSRLGLNFRAVLADSGEIGGDASHEFQVLANSGEDVIAYSDHSDYAANIERAETLPATSLRPKASGELATLDTPGLYTIDALCQAHNFSAQQSVKTLIVKGNESPLVALILRGDHQLNSIKAEKLADVFSPLTFAEETEIEATIGCKPGSIGPVNLSIPVIVDYAAAKLADFVCGANTNDKHYVNVNWERDVNEPNTADLRNVEAGDPSPDGKGTLQLTKGIEVGHIFQLGDKYSLSMNANVLNQAGKKQALQMGCYGIGISRIVAAAIEQNHDENGIIWSKAMAPFQIALLPIHMAKSQRLKFATEALYNQLLSEGFEVLFDDRNERPGTMFANVDLLGIPHRLVFSERGLNANTIEYKARTSQETQTIKLEELVNFLHKV